MAIREGDPYRAYNFKLEIQGVTQGHFTQCSGMGVKIDSIPYREGGNQQIVRQLPGIVHYGDISLRYGLTDSRELFDWLLATAEGNEERRNVSVICLDSNGIDERMRWSLFEAWPTEWRAAPLDALQSEVAIETLTFVYERLERA